MSKTFFPSCKVTRQFPVESTKLREYIEHHEQAFTTGCCKVNFKQLSKTDTAIVVCNNCGAIISESSSTSDISFVWEIIDSDLDFVYPDYHGEKVTIQDCWRAYDRNGVHRAVRSILRKMNLEIVELRENRRNCKFCGADLLNPCTDIEKKLAPKRYAINGADMYVPRTITEQDKWLHDWCEQIETDKVVCYCLSCLDGIKRGGKQGIHLIELLFPNSLE